MPARPPPRPPANLDAFAEAVAFFRERLIMTDEEFADLEGASYDQAFTIAGVAELDVVTDVWDALDRAIAQGETLDDFRDRVEERLTNAWGREMPWRIETIARTNLQRAYSVGRWEQMEHPAVKEARPFRRYLVIDDERLCPICEPCDGVVLPVDHPWWQSHQVPAHYNCRCRIDTLSDREAYGSETTTPPGVQFPEGFGEPPDTDWQPDLTEYPQPLVAEYRR